MPQRPALIVRRCHIVRLHSMMLRPAAIIVAASSCTLSQGQVPTITNLGVLPGDPYSQVSAVSADGSVVVGNRPYGAFRWTDRGMEGLGFWSALGISHDGSVAVGFNPWTDGFAVRWTDPMAGGTGLVSLGGLPGGILSRASGASADGSVVVGFARDSLGVDRAFRWTSDTGMVALPLLPGGTYAAAGSVSADGSVVVGSGSEPNGHVRAVRWIGDEGAQSLGNLAGAVGSYGIDVSGDGSVVAGTSFFGSTSIFYHVIRWTSGGGMEDLGTLSGAPGFGTIGRAVSGDGSVIAGGTLYEVGPSGEDLSKAILWNASMGIVDLNAYLPSLGLDLTGWELKDARDLKFRRLHYRW